MSDSDTVPIERLFLLLSYSFPSVAFVCVVNAGLSDNVFCLAALFGSTFIPKRFRKLMERGFALVAALVGGLAATWTLGSCKVGPEFCSSAGLLSSPLCARAAAVSIVVIFVSLLCDRVCLPVVGIKESRMSRVADSFGVAIAWIALSEQDPVASLAIAVLSLRRLRFFKKRLGLWAVGAGRIGLVTTSFLSMGGLCRDVSHKNAAGAMLLSVVV